MSINLSEGLLRDKNYNTEIRNQEIMAESDTPGACPKSF